MFELMELDPRFSADTVNPQQRRGAVESHRLDTATRGTASTIRTDDGHLSQGETLLLLAALSSVVGSLWLTTSAII